MGASLRKINRRIASNIVAWAGVPKKKLSLRQRMILLMMKLANQRKQAAERLEANTAENLRDLVENENLTPEALQARKDAEDVEVSPVPTPENH